MQNRRRPQGGRARDGARCPGPARAPRTGRLLGAALALALLSTGLARAQDDWPTAPDGHRGLGATSELQDVLKVLRGRGEDDRVFVERLDALVSGLEELTAELADHYAARGAFALLGPAEAPAAAPAPAAARRGKRVEEEEAPRPSLSELHAAFRAAGEDPLAALAVENEARARAFAELYLDTRFRARMDVLAPYEAELEQFRSGLAVLRAGADGWVVLSQTELQNVITRVDLSASYLRAIQKDLEVLRPKPDEASDPAVVTALVAAASARDETLRHAAFDAIAGLEEERLERMLGALFTGRFADSPAARVQVDWRERMRAQAIPLREEALTYLPGTPEAESAPPDVAERMAAMSKGDRLRWAERRAVEGLAYDPLDEDLVFVAAHCADYLWGDIQSRALYDRFLALRGIRSHDDDTLRDRELTERELEALAVVQRPFQPGQPGIPGRRGGQGEGEHGKTRE